MSTTKGCYIGQELIQRTTHVGTVRKQALPFMLKTPRSLLQINPENFNALRMVDRTYQDKLEGLEIVDKKKRKIGVVLGSQYNVGTALIDMPRLYKAGEEKQAEFSIEGTETIMWQPPWLQLLESQQEAESRPMTPEEAEAAEMLKKERVVHGERRPGDAPPDSL